MDCYLKKHLKEEHENMRDASYGSIIFTCSVFEGSHICMWCCLHTRDVANPLTRNYAVDHHPDYAIKSPEISKRDLDSIWETCSRCHNAQA